MRLFSSTLLFAACAFLVLAGSATASERNFYRSIQGKWTGPGEIVAGKYKGTKFICTFAGIAPDSANGIDRVIDRAELNRRGGFPTASYLVNLRSGFTFGYDARGPLVRDVPAGGMHGYLPDVAAMRSSFFIVGPTIPRGRDLGVIDQRAIAPTLRTCCQPNVTWAAVLAVICTSLMFSIAHHVGPTGEAFRLFPFTFRLLAGLFFAVLFGLSNDYEVYLVSRMHEERERGADAIDAVTTERADAGFFMRATPVEQVEVKGAT